MFVYVFTEKQYKKSVRILLSIWVADLILRISLFLIFGSEFILLGFISGAVVGITSMIFVIYRRSSKIDDGLVEPVDMAESTK
jgi:hypothetical protein